VDDEEDLLSTFARILKVEGYSNVKAFSDSRKVLMHICEPKYSTHYRMAIIDIRMPDINGIKLYQILKVLNPRLKVLFITALDAVDELTSIYPDVRPTDIIKKPVSREQLVNSVNNRVINISQDL
jgi:two-component system response regulator ChvI